MQPAIKSLKDRLLPLFRGNQTALAKYLNMNRSTLRKHVNDEHSDSIIVIGNRVYKRVGEVNTDFDPVL